MQNNPDCSESAGLGEWTKPDNQEGVRAQWASAGRKLTLRLLQGAGTAALCNLTLLLTTIAAYFFFLI